MHNVTNSLIRTVVQKEDARWNAKIRTFVATLSMDELVNECMDDIQHAMETYVFGRDDSYQIFVPSGIAVIGKKESVVHVSQFAGTARTPERTTFLRLLYGTVIHERLPCGLTDQMEIVKFLSMEQTFAFTRALDSRLKAYATAQCQALFQSPFCQLIRTIAAMERHGTESKYTLRGPLEGGGKHGLHLQYDALRDVKVFHKTYLDTDQVHFYLSRSQYDQLKAAETTLYAIGLQVLESKFPSRYTDDYNEEGFLDQVRGKELRRQKRQKNKK